METSNSSKRSKTPLIAIIIGLLTAIIIILLLTKGCQAEKEYTVTFDSNGGSTLKSITVKENQKVNKPSDPVRDDYIFDGWEYNNEIFDFNTKITKDITLKARWNPIDDSIVLSSTSISVMVDEEKNIEIEDLPEGIDTSDLLWSSSDDSIVTVDSNGKIKTLKEGSVTITVKSKDGKYTARCTVTVTKEEIEIESISINGLASVTVGSSIKLTATFKPDNATSQKLTWKSSDNSIATVDEKGNVKGVKAGTVTITVTTENGKTATKKITVKTKSTSKNNNNNNNNTGGNSGGNTGGTTKPSEVAPTGVSISGATQVEEGKTIQLSANVQPSNATNKSVTWSSSDSGIARVDSKTGLVTGVKAGTATITVRTSNGKTATHQVTVTETKPEPQKQDSYSITFTRVRQEGTNNVMQYTFVVYKNGNVFTDYLGFSCGKTQTRSGNKHALLESEDTTAKLTLKDGTVVVATVNYMG